MLPYVFISVSYCCGGSGGIARSYLRCSFTSFRFSSIVDTQLSRLSLGSLFFAWLITGQPLAVGMKGLIFDSRMIWHTGVICVAVKHAQITIPIGVKCLCSCAVFGICQMWCYAKIYQLWSHFSKGHWTRSLFKT